MQKSGDVQGKLFEVYSLINKDGQDPKIKQEHTPAYNQCYAAYDGLVRQLMGMGQMQIPVQPIGDGMYAIPGNMLGFMAAANYHMYGAAFANFMGLDPQMYSKMYAQMRPSFTTNILVVDNNGIKFDVKVKLMGVMQNDVQLEVYRKAIKDHVYNFMVTSSTDPNAVKGDLMAFLEDLLPGSTIESTNMVNTKTGEKLIPDNENETEGNVKKSDKVVNPAGTSKQVDQTPKQRFDCTLSDKGILTITDNGTPIVTEPADKITPKQVEAFRAQLAAIDETQLKTPDDVRRVIDSALATMGLGDREIGE